MTWKHTHSTAVNEYYSHICKRFILASRYVGPMCLKARCLNSYQKHDCNVTKRQLNLIANILFFVSIFNRDLTRIQTEIEPIKCLIYKFMCGVRIISASRFKSGAQLINNLIHFHELHVGFWLIDELRPDINQDALIISSFESKYILNIWTSQYLF